MKLAAPRENLPARLLVVDDEPLIRESLRVILEVSGYLVELAACASQALAILAQRAFDLMVTGYHSRA